MAQILYRDGDLCKRCVRCQEWWPLLNQFWWRVGTRPWHSWCRACCNERVAELRRARKLITNGKEQ
jgi:hypothetical protein